MRVPVSCASRLRRALSIALLACAAGSAAALPVPGPFVSGSAQFNREPSGTTIGDFGLLDHTVSGFGSLQFFSAGASLPVVRATADLHPTFGGTASGAVSGFVRYTFEITGPDAELPVFVDARAHVAGGADESGFFEATAAWALRNSSEIDLAGDRLSVFRNASGSAGSDADSVAGSHAVSLFTNREYRVVMTVLARAGTVDLGGHGDAEAFVDPLFRFGNGVDTSRFTFRFSDGIGNSRPATGLPLPGMPALVGAGLLALAVARRRRG